ncbi:hypothetical protein EG329_010907 [Mollisiaceae sp. DMI_Dod_QoI]|nr:hypothetical protein EG329_010907 [Helotiales sp. DMI_Dod_QoI]
MGGSHSVTKSSRSVPSSKELGDLGASASKTSDGSLGLKVFYTPEIGYADIVFVHGITGHRELTWKAKGSPIFWPEDLLPRKVQHARVLTFGYDSSVVNWRSIVSQNRLGNHARNLLHSISHLRDSDGTTSRPLFLIAHSLGGLVCEDALLNSRNSADAHLKAVLESTRGIIFLGTPHFGAGLANYAETFARLVGVLKQTTKEIVRVLTTESEVLARIQTDFHTMIRDRAQQGHAIPIICFYEELPLPGIGPIVPMHSAILSAYPHIGIHANHMEMGRFSSEEDPGFISIAGELRRWVQKLKPIQVITSGPSTGIFDVPHPRHRNFVGRQNILDALTKSLMRSASAALSGIGGVGKTEIAIEYCYKFHESHPYTPVFWISADTIEKFEQSYMNVAKRLRLPGIEDPKTDVLELVTEYLKDEKQGPWLMILDNADDVEMFTTTQISLSSRPLARFIPQSKSGKLIITTRDTHAGFVLTGGEDPVIVYPPSQSDAAILLRSSLSKELDPEEKIVQQILDILDCLPLAVTQASAYINRNKITTAQYLKELTESDEGLQAILSDDQYDGRRDLDSINSVIRTWKLSFDSIQKKSLLAARLLCVMALLDRQDIPRDLLRACTDSQHQLTSALGILQAFSMIRAERGLDTYSMHRLVQYATCVWQEMQGSKKEHQKDALNLVHAKFPVAENDDRAACQLLLPHAHAVRGYEPDDLLSQGKLADLLFNIGWFETEQGRYRLAKDLALQSLQIRQEICGNSHLETLRTAGLLGSISKYQGSHVEAMSLHKGILEQQELILGPSHMDTMQTLSELTDLFTRQGDYLAAERTARRVLAARIEALGSDNVKTLITSTTLAHILTVQGRYDAALELVRATLEKFERILGSEHEKSLLCKTVLYRVLQAMGQYREAIELCLEVVSSRAQLLGPEHRTTLTGMNNLAMLHRLLGDFEASENLYWIILPILERTCGSENPDVMATCSNLAVVLRDQHKFEAAEHWSRLALERRERVLGRGNPRTLITLNEHAKLLDMQGKYDEALDAATRALQSRIKLFGEEHPETATSCYTLASVMKHEGDLEEAKDLLKRALVTRLKLLGENHPDTLACTFELSVLSKE